MSNTEVENLKFMPSEANYVSVALRSLVVMSGTGSAIGLTAGCTLLAMGSSVVTSALVWGLFGSIATSLAVFRAMSDGGKNFS